VKNIRSFTFFRSDEEYDTASLEDGEFVEFSTMFRETSAVTTTKLAGRRKIRIINEDKEREFLEFAVSHEHLKKESGRYMETSFDYYFAKIRMTLWAESNSGVLTVMGPGKSVEEVLKRCRISGEIEIYDIERLWKIIHDEELANIKGAYFGDLRITNVNSAMIFGTRVDDSDEFTRYNDFGSVTGLIITIEELGETIRIGRSGIVLYSNCETDLEYLENALGKRKWINSLLSTEKPLFENQTQ